MFRLLTLGADSFLASKPKDVAYCYLTDKEFKMTIMKKFSKIQENSEISTIISEIKLTEGVFYQRDYKSLGKNTNSGAEELSKWDKEYIRMHWK